MQYAKPELVFLKARKLAGKRRNMSLVQNETESLWQSFMKTRHMISDVKGTDLYSLQQYPETYFQSFQPNAVFEKWAAVEVSDWTKIPEGFELLELPEGWYAVFPHKGSENTAEKFQYIFTQWLPASAYQLDQRPHFELLGANYQHNHPDSEETIWIPVVKRS